jgi:CDP-diacylglycerol--glycerol-3-phosphate 3-phosphatidyltransferase
VLTRREYLSAWSGAHGDAPTGGVIGAWLGVVHLFASPLVRRGLGPDAVTALALGAAVGATAASAAGGRWVLASVVLVVLSGLLDGLDGAVAVLSDRVTRWGAVLDAVGDRLAEAAFVGALWLAGAPGWLCVAAGAVAWLHEYLRARAGQLGMAEVGVISVAEKPTRVIVTAMFLLGAAVYPVHAAAWSGAGAAAWATLGAIGLLQLAAAVHRTLR